MAASHLNMLALKINLRTRNKGLAILAFHGRNQEPQDMIDLMARLGWEAHTMILPNALDKSWYPGGFMDQIEINNSKLTEALKTVSKYHNELNNLGFKDEHIVMMGFSQGACLAAQYCLLNPRRFKAIAILTGGFIGQTGIDWKFSGNFAGTPTLVTTSKVDEWVPPIRARETAVQFEAMNANVVFKLFDERPHEVCDEELELVKNLIS